MKRNLTILIFLLVGLECFCTHIRGGYMVVSRVEHPLLSYEITVVGLRDVGSTIHFGGNGVLNFGDGNVLEGEFRTNVPELIGYGVEAVSFTALYTFVQPNATGYLISYAEEFRNADILNIQDSENVTFYIESRLIIDPALPSHSLSIQSVADPFAYTGQTYKTAIHLAGVEGKVDFWKIIPKKSHNSNVEYLFPNDASFYQNHSSGNEGKSSAPSYTVDRLSGTLTWDAPEQPGEYTIAMLARQQSLLGDTYITTHTTVFEQQVIVLDEEVHYPDIEVPDRVCAGDGFLTFDVMISANKGRSYELRPYLLHSFNVNGILIDTIETLTFYGDTIFHFESPFALEDDEIHRGTFHLVPNGLASQSFGLVYSKNCSDLMELVTVNHEVVRDEIRIFPNPSAGDFMVRAGGSGAKKLRIVTISGHQVYEQEVITPTLSINLQGSLKGGMYLIQFLDEDERLLNIIRLIIVK